MVNTPRVYCRGRGFDPCRGTKIPHAPQPTTAAAAAKIKNKGWGVSHLWADCVWAPVLLHHFSAGKLAKSVAVCNMAITPHVGVSEDYRGDTGGWPGADSWTAVVAGGRELSVPRVPADTAAPPGGRIGSGRSGRLLATLAPAAACSLLCQRFMTH